jgi:hypothetical protein
MTDAQFTANIESGMYNPPRPGARTGATPGAKAAPKTGTDRTRLNAYTHGLTGQIHLFTDGEQKAFALHCKGIVESLAPVGDLETTLAQSVAENHWRLQRIRTIESCAFAVGLEGGAGHPACPQYEDPGEVIMGEAISKAQTWIFKGNHLALLSLYEGRISRTIERTMVELRTLRAERKAARDQILAEALLLAQHARSKGETYDPARDFPPGTPGLNSDFSTADIARLISRNQRLADARNHTINLQKPAARTPAAV